MAQVIIRKNGRVETRIGTQDIGGGARTVTALVTSMVFGYLPLEKIDVKIGRSDLPPSGASGGSATTGMINKEVRDAAARAAQQLFEACAGELKTGAGDLEFREGGRVGVKGRADEIPWENATGLLRDDAIGHFTVPLEDESLWFLAREDGSIKQGGYKGYNGPGVIDGLFE